MQVRAEVVVMTMSKRKQSSVLRYSWVFGIEPDEVEVSRLEVCDLKMPALSCQALMKACSKGNEAKNA